MTVHSAHTLQPKGCPQAKSLLAADKGDGLGRTDTEEMCITDSTGSDIL